MMDLSDMLTQEKPGLVYVLMQPEELHVDERHNESIWIRYTGG